MEIFLIKEPSVKTNCMKLIVDAECDGKTEVIIRKKKSTRSVQQNALYWKWMTVLAEHIGEKTKDDMHNEFSTRLLGPELLVVDGKQYIRIKSTTELSVSEFTDYLEKISAAAMALEVSLPSPEYYGY